MNCACGVKPSYDATFDGASTAVDNGKFCIDCGTFTCTACFDAAPQAATGFRDRDLCIGCNARPLVDTDALYAGLIHDVLTASVQP